MNAGPAVLAVDVGNSRVGLTRWIGGAVTERRRGSSSTPAGWQEELAAATRAPLAACVLGSVGAAGPAVEEWLQRHLSCPVTAFHRGDELGVATRVQEAGTTGVDRIAAAMGAHEAAAGAVLVADVGTAITVDWMDRDGVFEGGSIVPGRQLCLAALAQGTARLPALPPWDDDRLRSLPGRSTEEAIRHGLDRGLVGMVEALVGALREAAGADVPLWVTGGDAAWWCARTRLPHRRDPDLVARGLLACWRRKTGAA